MYTSAKPYFYGTGRRKKSVARVRLYQGTGSVTINGFKDGLTIQNIASDSDDGYAIMNMTLEVKNKALNVAYVLTYGFFECGSRDGIQSANYRNGSFI